MKDDLMQWAWLRQAQLDAARGVIACRMCKATQGLDETVTLWRNGALVFAVCDTCASRHDILMSPVEDGVEVRARARAPLVIGGLA